MSTLPIRSCSGSSSSCVSRPTCLLLVLILFFLLFCILFFAELGRLAACGFFFRPSFLPDEFLLQFSFLSRRRCGNRFVNVDAFGIRRRRGNRFGNVDAFWVGIGGRADFLGLLRIAI